jgi:hypothetical protein
MMARYAGTMGGTQGERNEIRPPPKAATRVTVSFIGRRSGEVVEGPAVEPRHRQWRRPLPADPLQRGLQAPEESELLSAALALAQVGEQAWSGLAVHGLVVHEGVEAPAELSVLTRRHRVGNPLMPWPLPASRGMGVAADGFPLGGACAEA